MKEHLVQIGMDRLKLLPSVALAPTNLEAPMARPLAIHGTLIIRSTITSKLTLYNVPRHLALILTNQVMKCEEGTHLHATNQVMKFTTRTLIHATNPSDEMYNSYSPSCHQPGDQMYNPYSNIIWQLATHATNQVKKELIFMPPTR
ncbi:hypothetical protein EV1_035446 [Malus domestica]